MCGVSGGLVLAHGGAPIDVGAIERLNEFQRARGPDGAGVWRSDDGLIALGHRRLSLIELTDAGAQPMWDATRRFVISFNGEIYNHAALRAELVEAGRRFVTRSDTEVLLNAYAQWGERCFARLRGMYAFALWDSETRELVLARDPFGIKPLYYTVSNDRIWFASQARALAQCVPCNTARDAAGLVGFYLFGYVPEPFTWWEGISLLPAGHLLKLRPGRSLPEPRAHTRIEQIGAAPARVDDDALRAALRQSVEAHLVADAPVGVFLSAGVDSTALATFAVRRGASLRTVTLAFDAFRGTPQDEAPLAEETARALGADHQTIRLSRDATLGEIDGYFSAMDQPTTDGLNVFLVSRAASMAGVKAALSGLGGDELFRGYPLFAQIPAILALGACLPARDALGAFVERVASPLASAFGLNPKYASTLRYSGNVESAYFLRRCLHTLRELETLLDETWREEGLSRLGLVMTPDGAGASITSLELSRYMRNQPLRDADWASMAHSLEVRTPFLDIPLLHMLAPALNSATPPTKSDLARVSGALAIKAGARRKTGFVTPISDWMRRSSGDAAGLRPFARRVAAAFRVLPPTFASGMEPPRAA